MWFSKLLLSLLWINRQGLYVCIHLYLVTSIVNEGIGNPKMLEIHQKMKGHQEGEVWGLATHPREPLAVTASDDGTVRVWSLTSHKMLSVHAVGGAARSVTYSHDGGTIAVGLKDGSFKVFDRDWNELAKFHHRKEEISDIKFSPNGKYLAVGSHDDYVDLYSVSGRKRVGICKGPSSYITHIDWDTAGKLLQVNTGDREVLYFEAPRGKQHFIPQDTIETLTWSTWTCVLGPSVQGVWPPYTDVTDINAASVSSDGEVIATGDDFGFVKIFKFPSHGKHAKYRQYVGHSAHVTNVRFSHDDSRLVSAGGADTAIIVWRNHGGATRDTGPDDDQVDSPVGGARPSAHVSEDSDTDSEEEGGYDSDVEREKLMDYSSKIYSAPIRDAAVAQGNLKPHLQSTEDSGPKARVSRGSISSTKVVFKEKQTKVNDLALDYIFGYRGFDTRQNIFCTPDDRVLYHAAGAGVVYNPLSNSQAFYLEHNDDIISLAICRHQKLRHVVATGQLGKSAPIHVWDSHSKQTLSILHGAHGIGVCSLDFSCNGKLLLAVGLDNRHSITVWRWNEGSKAAQVSGDHCRIFTAQFRPDSNTKFVSCGVKHVRFWNLVGTELVNKKGYLPKSCGARMQTMLSLAFAPEEVTLTGSVGGDVYVWKSHSLTRVVSQVHSGPVMAMYTCLEDGLILTAGKDRSADGGGVKLWGVDMSRSRTFPLGDVGGGVVRSIARSKGRILVGTQDNRILEIEEKTGDVKVLVEGHGEGELWGLAVHPSSNTFITASDDKTVKLWDLKTKATLCETSLSCSARSADISADGQLAVVGQTNGEFVLLSTSDLSVLHKKRDRSKTLQVMRFSPDGSSVAVGSDDACVDIYSVSGFSRTGYCRGIPSQVTHLDWSHDAAYLQVNTSSYQRLVFCSSTGRQLTDQTQLDKIIWATWTCVLGNEVLGIWPKNADKADVNTVALSRSGNVAVTGDDFGCVKLFDHFPITEKFAANKKYFGHSAHVTRVKFTHDDSYLLSAGGDDSCVFAWKCIS